MRTEQFSTVSRRNNIGLGIGAGEYCRIWVTDNGEGVPHDLRERIFEPFYSTKDSQKGSGLGLSVVRGMTERFGGTITLHSKEGVGTSFALYLPLDESPTEGSSHDHQEESPRQVLFIDPEYAPVQELKKTLEDQGQEVLYARDLPSAVQLSDEHPEVNLVIVDASFQSNEAGDLRESFRRPLAFSTGFDPQSGVAMSICPPGAKIVGKPFNNPIKLSISDQTYSETSTTAQVM